MLQEFMSASPPSPMDAVSKLNNFALRLRGSCATSAGHVLDCTQV